MKLELKKDSGSNIDLYRCKHKKVFITIRTYTYVENNSLMQGYLGCVYNGKNYYSTYHKDNSIYPLVNVVKLLAKKLSENQFLNQPVFLEIK